MWRREAASKGFITPAAFPAGMNQMGVFHNLLAEGIARRYWHNQSDALARLDVAGTGLIRARTAGGKSVYYYDTSLWRFDRSDTRGVEVVLPFEDDCIAALCRVEETRSGDEVRRILTPRLPSHYSTPEAIR